jgi:hypothetical protein
VKISLHLGRTSNFSAHVISFLGLFIILMGHSLKFYGPVKNINGPNIENFVLFRNSRGRCLEISRPVSYIFGPNFKKFLRLKPHFWALFKICQLFMLSFLRSVYVIDGPIWLFTIRLQVYLKAAYLP